MTDRPLCPDPWGHARLYRDNETTWRKTREQIAADNADGCPHCDKAVEDAHKLVEMAK